MVNHESRSPIPDCPVHPKGKMGYRGLNQPRDAHIFRCLVDECGHIVAWPVDAGQHSREDRRQRLHGGARGRSADGHDGPLSEEVMPDNTGRAS